MIASLRAEVVVVPPGHRQSVRRDLFAASSTHGGLAYSFFSVAASRILRRFNKNTTDAIKKRMTTVLLGG